MESIEITGKTVEEAIKKAVAQLGVPRAQIKVQILCEEKMGLFGMAGATQAKIRATKIKNKS